MIQDNFQDETLGQVARNTHEEAKSWTDSPLTIPSLKL